MELIFHLVLVTLFSVYKVTCFLLNVVLDAVPKKILKLMNDPTLTRENIASHLQVIGLYLFYIFKDDDIVLFFLFL